MKESFLVGLNDKQKDVCISHENLLVTACPGSGKTRTLTHKIGFYLENSDSLKSIVAITYTNRAADEIIDRLDILGVDYSRVWVGTIHQFCLEHILNRFKMYDLDLSKGYKIIDERITNNYIQEIAKSINVKISYDNKPNLRKDRKFQYLETNPDFLKIIDIYYEQLREKKEIDFDTILLRSYRILIEKPFVCELIKNNIELLCVDEFQDTQDLQYAIIEKIYNSNTNKMEINFFGDPNQSIYETLGGCSKSLNELNKEFFDASFCERILDGCYRSPQNIIDFYSEFMVTKYNIYSKKDDVGSIHFSKSIKKDDVYKTIAKIIDYYLKHGVQANDICIIAPTWAFLFPFSKQIKSIMPNVPFDAPDITPIKKDNLNVFYNICYLALTKPSVKRLLFRRKVASDILSRFADYIDFEPNPMDFLNCLNSNDYIGKKGTEFVKRTIENCLNYLKIDLNKWPNLNAEYNNFMNRIYERLNKKDYNLSDDLDDFRNMFMDKDGVVINTIHGIKGEEYEVVIAFGLLNSKVPFTSTPNDIKDNVANRLLYVMASRSKKYLYMISEDGRYLWGGQKDTPCKYLMKAINKLPG